MPYDHQTLSVTYLKLVLVSLLWGGGFIAGKILMNAQTGPYAAAFNRFLVASACLLIILLRVEGKLPRLSGRQWLLVGALGLSGVFLYNAFFFNGLRYIPASRASLIVAVNPVVTAIASAVVFREKITWLRWLGIGLSMAGAVVVISHGQPQNLWNGGISIGDGLIFGCVLVWTVYTLVGKVALRDLSPLVAVTYSSVAGCIALFVMAVPEGLFAGYRSMDAQMWAAIAFLGVFSTALAFNWFYEGVKAIGASQAAVFGNLVPVFAVLLAVIVLGERIDASTVIGGGLVLAGVMLTNRIST